MNTALFQLVCDADGVAEIHFSPDFDETDIPAMVAAANAVHAALAAVGRAA